MQGNVETKVNCRLWRHQEQVSERRNLREFVINTLLYIPWCDAHFLSCAARVRIQREVQIPSLKLQVFQHSIYPM